MKTHLLVALLLCTLLSKAQQISKQLTGVNGKLIGFLEYKPTDYQASDKTKKYPLIVFLHGMGEKGNGTTELYKVKANAIPKYIGAGNKMTFTFNNKTETFLVLSPQLSTEYTAWPTFYAEEMIQYAKTNLNVDTNRIILAGLSLGGGGVWYYAATDINNTRKLAAIGISCGTKRTANYGLIAQANLPTWAFHATDDPQVPVYSTNSIIQLINDAKPAVAPYKTIWPTGGHAIWDRVYDTTYNVQNPNIYEWFLAQDKSLPVNIRPVAKAGSDITISSTFGTATLNGAGSTDADGVLRRFIWRQLSGPSTVALANAISTDGIASVAGAKTVGQYTFELKAVDNRADYTLDTMTLNVIVDVPPIANAGADQVITLPVSSVTVDGKFSSDSDGSISSYSWSQESGPSQANIESGSTCASQISGLIEGSYRFKLTVRDNLSIASVAYINVQVNTIPNIAPTARSGNDDTLMAPVSSVFVDGTASSDKDGTIVRYKWVKLLGPTSFTITSPDQPTTTITNLVTGSYKFRLIVYDNRGDSGMDNHYVVIQPEVSPMSRTTIPSGEVTNTQESVYPNPASNTVHVQYAAETECRSSVRIYNLSGQLVSGRSAVTHRGVNRQALDLKDLTGGIYQVVISRKGMQPVIQRIIKE